VGDAGSAYDRRACAGLVVPGVTGIALTDTADISSHASRAVRVRRTGMTVIHAAAAGESGAAIGVEITCRTYLTCCTRVTRSAARASS
jgi:hypothetical protein